MQLADTLSRAYLLVNRCDIIHPLEAGDHTVHDLVVSECLHQIIHVTAVDLTLSLLYDLILDGWPSRMDITM